MQDTLSSACDRVLSEALPPGLCRAIDGALAAGMAPDVVLGLLRSLARGRTPVVLAAEAYLHANPYGRVTKRCVVCRRDVAGCVCPPFSWEDVMAEGGAE